MKALTLATISALSVITIGTAAFAAGPGMGPMGFGPSGGPMKLFTEADTNKDGKVDAAEFTTYRDKMFGEANGDGKDGVNIQEFEPWFWKQHREMMVRAFQRLDSDGDGQISKAEVDAAGERMLSRFDRNNDGVLSADDRPNRGDGWGRDGQRGRHHGQGMGMMRGGWMGQGQGPGPVEDGTAD